VLGVSARRQLTEDGNVEVRRDLREEGLVPIKGAEGKRSGPFVSKAFLA
jgi:hypothetical protein